MTCDVTHATYIRDYRLELEFGDGSWGIVDLSKHIARRRAFRRLRERDVFRNFVVDREIGTLRWPGEVKIAPETLYAEATGRALPTVAEPTNGGPSD